LSAPARTAWIQGRPGRHPHLTEDTRPGRDSSGPHIEVSNEPKHGIIDHAKVDEMNLESDKWVAGIEQTASAHPPIPMK
jgi:hypothetical protein